MPPRLPLQVLYDGGCKVCHREMASYQRRDLHGSLRMIDISLPTFDPVPYGLSQEEVMTQLHVMDADGTIYRGIDGFRAIWSAFAERLPYRLLIVLFGLPGVRLLARFGYWLFARFRRFLPRNQCQGSCPLH